MRQPNFWIIGSLALLINLAVTFGLIVSKAHEFVKTPEEIVEEVITIGSPQHFDFLTQSIDDLVANLQEERAKVEERERLMEDLEERLNSEREELIRLRSEIETYRDELASKVFELEASEEKNLKSLATTYANISPEAAVAIFAEMDDVFVVKIMSYMPVDAVAPIFQSMSRIQGEDGPMSERVARFSEMMRLKIDSKKNQ